ncbi:hypothetical protein IMZ31_19980 (plasmid) [Pontibacillus sp. ALD_SL1]|uniref:hypothetical protein n=1 Tax=Pontibacillus sp. ALD_SL1 TaxID=2777185 RepID=UPI001A96E364|nr:hypothetical protein [Pontibacillus sp. ALD_SL1]QST02831.1 hypothetical protein IMZ31_19980 [Pontibacillus sp. ALD_SL1]
MNEMDLQKVLKMAREYGYSMRPGSPDYWKPNASAILGHKSEEKRNKEKPIQLK